MRLNGLSAISITSRGWLLMGSRDNISVKDRKILYIKKLENRVKELEKENKDLRKEIAGLK